MNNEPVAWISKDHLKEMGKDGFKYTGVSYQEDKFYNIPLYTHPAKTIEEENNMRFEQGEYWSASKCLDREGAPTEDEGGKLSLWGRICKFAHPAKTLTDEEIIEFIKSWEGLVVTNRTMEMFRAILKKASEK